VGTKIGWARCPDAMMGCSKYFHESAAYAHAMRDATVAEVWLRLPKYFQQTSRGQMNEIE
jgi:hypothetical protein